MRLSTFTESSPRSMRKRPIFSTNWSRAALMIFEITPARSSLVRVWRSHFKPASVTPCNCLRPSGEYWRFTVAAIARAGIGSIDGHSRLFARAGRTNAAATTVWRVNDHLQTARSDRAPALASHFEKLFQHGADSWQQREESTLQLFLTLRMSSRLPSSLIILLAGFGIFNVLTMSVLAKIKEIAILRSMGYRRIDISAIFLWQGALIAVAGSVFGCLLGALMTWGVSHIPIRIRGLLYTDYFLVTWDWRHYVFATLLAILAVFIASYVPARARPSCHQSLRCVVRAYEWGNLPQLQKRSSAIWAKRKSASMRCVASHSISSRPVSTLLSVPSGCGKSTLLYILGLLDPPDAGRVSIESEPMLHLSDDELARKRNEFIGFIFQFHF
jgi:hypothetical protein